MAVETFTDSDGIERIRKNPAPTITFNDKDWSVNFNVQKDDYTVGDNTDMTLAENDLDDALFNLVNHAIVCSYHLTEEEMQMICPNVVEITE